MPTLDELTDTLKNAASAHATAAIEADLLNCLDFIIEVAAGEPDALVQAQIPAANPPSKIEKLESALSKPVGTTPAAPAWIEDFKALVASVRSQTGLKRPRASGG